ncbi:uncharacterized protein LOC115634292 isoform X2 [Scaptodrosophila lebanonensis]|uniref:Uncharacterized protein LOC115634292 isoform X2 n=1 Tax=Drosophila lebanonensis TaxID=7225 RepID=A0A6J2UI31_DROLE|nr:uncharacterized protein LOC115634292 isoform X2 [Scaptodrosophila lebanonensis]
MILLGVVLIALIVPQATWQTNMERITTDIFDTIDGLMLQLNSKHKHLYVLHSKCPRALRSQGFYQGQQFTFLRVLYKTRCHSGTSTIHYPNCNSSAMAHNPFCQNEPYDWNLIQETGNGHRIEMPKYDDGTSQNLKNPPRRRIFRKKRMGINNRLAFPYNEYSPPKISTGAQKTPYGGSIANEPGPSWPYHGQMDFKNNRNVVERNDTPRNVGRQYLKNFEHMLRNSTKKLEQFLSSNLPIPSNSNNPKVDLKIKENATATKAKKDSIENLFNELKESINHFKN